MLKTNWVGWPQSWRRTTWISIVLQPFALIYAAIGYWRQQSIKPQRCACPVVVVGNIVVGGSGKTLMLSWLIEQCQRLDIKVGVISRGYGAQSMSVQPVNLDSDCLQVGDEPLLLRHMNVPVVVAKRRILAAARLLQDHPDLDLVLSDDGLQHYELKRDLELCLFAGEPGIGNARLLPAGPLREPLNRLNRVDWVICKSQIPDVLKPWSPLLMTLQAQSLRALPNSLANPQTPPSVAHRVVALCGIGQPDSFFNLLHNQGWRFDSIALPDHAVLDAERRQSLVGRIVLMTTKDAIKLRNETLAFEAWEVPVRAVFSNFDRDRILHSLVNLLSPQVADRLYFKDKQHEP